jgi:hypothetical protein
MEHKKNAAAGPDQQQIGFTPVVAGPDLLFIRDATVARVDSKMGRGPASFFFLISGCLQS